MAVHPGPAGTDPCTMNDVRQPVALRLLAAGVPLSLLIDLVCGPDSEAIAASEGVTSGSPLGGCRLVTGPGGGARSGE